MYSNVLLKVYMPRWAFAFVQTSLQRTGL